MAVKRTNHGVVAFGVFAVVAAVIGGGLYWMSRSSATASGAGSAAQQPPPALPEGKLLLAGAGVSQARYVTAEPTGGPIHTATVLVVGRTATAIEQSYAMAVKRELVDCANHAIGQELVAYYDQTGKLVLSQFKTGPAGRPAKGDDSEATLLCGQALAPAWRTQAGWRAAQREIQAPPADIDDQLKARPRDAELLAWRCRSIAHGEWRPDGRELCDKAVKLSPDDAAVRLDRAYLALIVGDRATAKRDFDAVAQAAPDNAGALFGRSLVAAVQGAKAASKTDRDRALKIDPKVPDWVEATYRYQISDPYRG